MDGGLEKPIKKMLDITPGKGVKAKALGKKMSSTAGINKARKEQGYKPKKFDRATKGMYDFLDKYD